MGLFGAALLAVGGLMLKYYFFDALFDASQHEPVTLGSKGLIFAPGTCTAGLGLLGLAIWPGIWKRSEVENLLPIMVTVAIVAASLLGGFFLRLWLKAHLQALGYDVG